MVDDGKAERDELAEVLRLKMRGGNDYWYWKDKPEMEVGAAAEVLTRARVSFHDLKSRGDDPPDCEAIIDGERAGIEVTELVHERALRSTIKGNERFFVWDKLSLVGALQDLIDRKDRPWKINGAPYARYFLIVVTDEFALGTHDVSLFLKDTEFTSQLITDAYFALSYDPSYEDGSCPVFRLELSRK